MKNTPLNKSFATEDDDTRSCESAVDMIAASIPQRSIPPINGRLISFMNNFLIISIYTFSFCDASVERTVGNKYALPITPIIHATASDNNTQTIATFFDLASSFSSLTAMNRTNMCGIPQYPSPQASCDKTLMNDIGLPFS